MKQLKGAFRLVVLVVVIGIVAFFVFTQWSWVFSKKIEAKVLDVKRVTHPNAIISSRVTDAQLHSYSILLEDNEGKLFTTSSDDRQWEVVTRGYCVTARLFRFPPWELDKAGTFFNARILDMRFCDPQHPPEPRPQEPEAPPQIPIEPPSTPPGG